MAYPVFLDSTKVKISFPNVRRENDWRSRLNSEAAFADNVKSLTPDSAGTFIMPDYKVISNAFDIKFYLAGYFFHVELPNDEDHIWVGISIEKTTTTSVEYTELVGQNDTSTPTKYTGLKFANTKENLGACDATLQLLTGAGAPYSVNTSAFLAVLWKTYLNLDLDAVFVDFATEDGSKPLDEKNQLRTGKLWIDSSDHFITRAYYNGVWVKLGAVYK